MLASRPVQEYALERTLDKMQAEWSGVVLSAAPWRATGTTVLRGTDDIQQLLDDQVNIRPENMSLRFGGRDRGDVCTQERGC